MDLLTVGAPTYMPGGNVFLTIAAVLVVLWILGFGVFHVAGGLIHLLVVVAIISVIWHFLAGRRTV
jgi:hypothetical protein